MKGKNGAIYKDDDFKFMKNYIDENTLLNHDIDEIDLIINDAIIQYGFDEEYFYNEIGKRLQIAYDNFIDMN